MGVELFDSPPRKWLDCEGRSKTTRAVLVTYLDRRGGYVSCFHREWAKVCKVVGGPLLKMRKSVYIALICFLPALGLAETGVPPAPKGMCSVPMQRLASSQRQRSNMATLLEWTNNLHESFLTPDALLRSRAYDWAIGDLYLEGVSGSNGVAEINKDPHEAAERVVSLMEVMFDDSFYRAAGGENLVDAQAAHLELKRRLQILGMKEAEFFRRARELEVLRRDGGVHELVTTLIAETLPEYATIALAREKSRRWSELAGTLGRLTGLSWSNAFIGSMSAGMQNRGFSSRLKRELEPGGRMAQIAADFEAQHRLVAPKEHEGPPPDLNRDFPALRAQVEKFDLEQIDELSDAFSGDFDKISARVRWVGKELEQRLDLKTLGAATKELRDRYRANPKLPQGEVTEALLAPMDASLAKLKEYSDDYQRLTALVNEYETLVQRALTRGDETIAFHKSEIGRLIEKSPDSPEILDHDDKIKRIELAKSLWKSHWDLALPSLWVTVETNNKVMTGGRELLSLTSRQLHKETNGKPYLSPVTGGIMTVVNNLHKVAGGDE